MGSTAMEVDSSRQRQRGSTNDRPAQEAAAETLASAQVLLRSLHENLDSLAGVKLVELFGRVQSAFDEFPELELEFPRRDLVEGLLSSASGSLDGRAVPLLMFCAALDPSSGSAVSALLEKMARDGEGRAVAAVARILARRHDFSWDEIAPAVEQLRRQQRDEAVLELVSEVLGSIRLAPDRSAFEFGSVLEELLLEDGNRGDLDPSLLAAIAWSARNRLQRSTARPSGNGSTEALLSLAERLSAKLSPQLSPPSPILSPRSPWPSKRLAFAEFAAQWSGVSGVPVDWLPMMSLGSAGERVDGTVRAKPGEKGHIVFGPYFRLSPGDYRVRVRMETGRAWRWNYRRQPIAKLEAVADHGERYLTHHNVALKDCHKGEHNFLFVIPPPLPRALQTPIEVRIWTRGTLPISLSSITVEKCTPEVSVIPLDGNHKPRNDPEPIFQDGDDRG